MAVVHKKGSPLFDQAMKYGIAGAISLVFLLLVWASMGHGSGFMIVAFFGLAILTNYLMGQSSRRFSGSWGERKALSKLSDGLSDAYHVFVNIKVHEKMESDLVVVGPNGVFIVEVKSLKGKIEGGEKDKFWTLHKVGRRGGEYSKSIKNPLGQLRRNIFILSQYLKLEKCSAWIDGMVLFSNSDTEWLEAVPEKCLCKPALVPQYISQYVPRRPLSEAQISKIVVSLEKCQDGAAMSMDEFSARAGQLQHKPA